MMQLATLTFTEEIGKTLFGALATALFVSIAGYFAAGRWSQAREAERLKSEKELERQREDDERAREAARREFEVRTQLVERVSAEAARLYIICQHTRRVLSDMEEASPKEELRTRILNSLDEAYLSFSANSLTLENLIGARYGVAWQLGIEESSRRVFVRWHQIRDLLTLYYFNVRGQFPGKVLVHNSLAYGNCYHSGLEATRYFRDAMAPESEELSAMRKGVRAQYGEALRELIHGILADRIAIDATEIRKAPAPPAGSHRTP
ncbi:hypothetical protein ACQ86D_51390 [Streptomyces galilaeus]